MKNADLTSPPGIGGPFWRLQQRLGLLGPDRLPSVSSAFILAASAWAPPALLSAAQGDAWSKVLGARAFLLDFDAYARFIIAVAALVIMERIVAERSADIIRQFMDAGLVLPEEQSRFMAALQRARRRSGSAFAGAIVLGIAYAASASSLFVKVVELRISWAGNLVDGHVQFSPAGWWALLVSLPLFWFLVFGWFWRFVVLTRLLRDVARLKLQLVATHPDSSGGIGFLGLYPAMFSVLAFALSCVTAASGLQLVLFANWSLKSMAAPFLMWVALVLIFAVGPLIVFAPSLVRLKRRALLEYGVLACVHHRAFERKWVRSGAAAQDVLGTPDISSLQDLTTAVQSIKSMRVVPVGLEALTALLIATGLPWVAVLAAQVPVAKLLTTVANTLL